MIGQDACHPLYLTQYSSRSGWKLRRGSWCPSGQLWAAIAGPKLVVGLSTAVHAAASSVLVHKFAPSSAWTCAWLSADFIAVYAPGTPQWLLYQALRDSTSGAVSLRYRRTMTCAERSAQLLSHAHAPSYTGAASACIAVLTDAGQVLLSDVGAPTARATRSPSELSTASSTSLGTGLSVRSLTSSVRPSRAAAAHSARAGAVHAPLSPAGRAVPGLPAECLAGSHTWVHSWQWVLAWTRTHLHAIDARASSLHSWALPAGCTITAAAALPHTRVVALGTQQGQVLLAQLRTDSEQLRAQHALAVSQLHGAGVTPAPIAGLAWQAAAESSTVFVLPRLLAWRGDGRCAVVDASQGTVQCSLWAGADGRLTLTSCPGATPEIHEQAARLGEEEPEDTQRQLVAAGWRSHGHSIWLVHAGVSDSGAIPAGGTVCSTVLDLAWALPSAGLRPCRGSMWHTQDELVFADAAVPMSDATPDTPWARAATPAQPLSLVAAGAAAGVTAVDGLSRAALPPGSGLVLACIPAVLDSPRMAVAHAWTTLGEVLTLHAWQLDAGPVQYSWTSLARGAPLAGKVQLCTLAIGWPSATLCTTDGAAASLSTLSESNSAASVLDGARTVVGWGETSPILCNSESDAAWPLRVSNSPQLTAGPAEMAVVSPGLAWPGSWGASVRAMAEGRAAAGLDDAIASEFLYELLLHAACLRARLEGDGSAQASIEGALGHSQAAARATAVLVARATHRTSQAVLAHALEADRLLHTWAVPAAENGPVAMLCWRAVHEDVVVPCALHAAQLDLTSWDRLQLQQVQASADGEAPQLACRVMASTGPQLAPSQLPGTPLWPAAALASLEFAQVCRAASACHTPWRAVQGALVHAASGNPHWDWRDIESALPFSWPMLWAPLLRELDSECGMAVEAPLLLVQFEQALTLAKQLATRPHVLHALPDYGNPRELAVELAAALELQGEPSPELAESDRLEDMAMQLAWDALQCAGIAAANTQSLRVLQAASAALIVVLSTASTWLERQQAGAQHCHAQLAEQAALYTELAHAEASLVLDWVHAVDWPAAERSDGLAEAELSSIAAQLTVQVGLAVQATVATVLEIVTEVRRHTRSLLSHASAVYDRMHGAQLEHVALYQVSMADAALSACWRMFKKLESQGDHLQRHLREYIARLEAALERAAGA